MAGGLEPCVQNILEPLNRTFTFVITDTNAPAGTDTAILFDANTTPLVQPAGVTVVVQESSHEDVRNDVRSNPVAIQGLRMFVDNAIQFTNPYQILKRYPQGKEIRYLFQPTNYQSPTNLQGLIIDAPDFGVVVDGRTRILIPITRLAPSATVTVVFTLKAATAVAHELFSKSPKELAVAPRPTGNPVADLAIQNANRQLG